MRIIIHIGFPKTATTLLQERVYPEHPDLAYVGKYNSKIWMDLIYTRQAHYDAEIVRQKFLSYADKTKKGGLIISLERLAGNPLLAGYEGDLFADRLHQTFPEAEIVVFIRNQVDWIESFFVEMVAAGSSGKSNIKTFLNTRQFSGHKIGWNPEYLDYNEAILYYHKLFGKERINVFLFEALREDFDGFLETFFARLAIAPLKVQNTVVRGKIPSLHYHYLRVLNRFRPSILNPVQKSLPSSVERIFLGIGSRLGNLQTRIGLNSKFSCLDAQSICEISDFYKKSNQNLSERLNLPLAHYNYPV